MTCCANRVLFVPAMLAGLAAAANAQGSDPLAGVGPGVDDPVESFGRTVKPEPAERRPQSPEPEAPATEEAPSPLSLALAVDWTTAYYAYGFRQEDRGFILQPSAELGWSLAQREGFSLGLFAGVWNSFHDRRTGTDPADRNDVAAWYECDLYGGVGLASGRWSLRASYGFYISPSDAFDTIQQINLDLALDDSGWLGPVRLQPAVYVLIETGSNTNDGVGDRGVHVQPSLTPAFALAQTERGPVELSLPLKLGLSLSDFYQDETGDDQAVGYGSVGVRVSLPLPMPEGAGAWSLSAGLTAVLLNSHTRAFNEGKASELVGTVGVSAKF